MSRPTAGKTGEVAGWAGVWLAVAAAAGAPGWAAAATNMTPVAVSGFNRDVVVESTASGPPYSSHAQEFNPAEGTAFYQSGLPGTSYGLPASGSFTGATGDGTVFQFQPYTTNNALVMSSETGISSGTLTLLVPNTFSRIAIIANSASGGNVSQVTLKFGDGSTLVTNYNAQDWFFNPGFALQGVDRINLSSGGRDGGPTDPRFYQTTIDLAGILGAANKPLSSLTFLKSSAAQSTAIYAVSGLPASAIGLASVTNVPASNIQAQSATLGGFVTGTGGEAPSITLYYGTSDGGANASAWGHKLSLGLQTGAFGATLAGLLPATGYFYTASAFNSAGTVWAPTSARFTTLPLLPPVITNLPPTSVEGTFATLNGEVLSTGGQPPTVTLYYGTADGGGNPGSWANSLSLGTQSGWFAQTVAGLSPNTVYFYTCAATNNAGGAFATPSAMFTTGATNFSPGSVAVLTQHNDSGRTGMNLSETQLTTANVNTNQFGLLRVLPVDDQIYAQPLVMTNVSIPGRGSHNIVIVATVNDSVYAFDADDPSLTQPYWQVSFLSSNAVAPRNTDMTGACGGNYHDFSGNIGIVSTPVIDPATGTIYLVARTKEFGSTFVQRLHALDLSTGAERSYSPAVIGATHAGTGDGSVGGVITFDPQRQNQRAGLALVGGVVYLTWSSHCDWGPYHGWVMGYTATNLAQAVIYVDTPNGSDGGIWMSGEGPASDSSGNLYLAVGNGTVDASGTVNRGESFLKLTRSGSTLTVASWFTPYNYQALENGDLDLGSSGLLLIPGTSLAFGGGKEGVAYLVNRDHMGGLTSSTTTNNNVVQTFPVTTDEMHGGMVWWDGPGGMSWGYLWPASTYLQQYVFNRTNSLFVLPPAAQSPTSAPMGEPGGILALSANGTNAGTGILWASHQLGGDANQQVLPGVLRAYNAQNVSQELWNSGMLPARDGVGNFAKFVAPTVANGKVYMATFSNQLNVYGLLAGRLSIQMFGADVALTWVSGALQSAPQPGGPYADVPDASSPYVVPATDAARYFRLRVK